MTGQQPRLVWDGRDDRTPVVTAVLHPVLQVRPSGATGRPTRRLIEGDNLAVMGALLPAYEGRFDLIYADPPFLTGRTFRARIGRKEDSRRPESWDTAAGYGDRWDSPADYLSMLEARLRLMHRLLAPTGTLYVHLDWHASAYARVLLDEIFGADRLLNEIAWVYHGPSPILRAFNRKHDTLLAYSKSAGYVFNSAAVRVPYDPETVKTFRSSAKAGFGKIPDLQRGKVPEDWWYFPVVARLHGERTGYPTQKPEALLERIVLASSPPGGLVGDFFSGSGTTLACAERLGREWIGCDAHPLAIHVAHRRLLLQDGCRPYRVESADPQPASLMAVAAVERRGSQVAVRLDGLLPRGRRTPSLEDIDFWEVDWDYTGGVFHSRSQAIRPWRSSELPSRLEHRLSSRRRRRLAVRVVARDGRIGLLTLRA